MNDDDDPLNGFHVREDAVSNLNSNLCLSKSKFDEYINFAIDDVDCR